MPCHIVINKYKYCSHIKVMQYSNSDMTNLIGIFHIKEYKIIDEDTFYYVKLSDGMCLYPVSYIILEQDEAGEMQLVEQKSICKCQQIAI